MAFVANYSGDVRHIIGEVKGPDTCGAIYRAKVAEFDPEAGKTRVEFEIVLPSDPDFPIGGAR